MTTETTGRRGSDMTPDAAISDDDLVLLALNAHDTPHQCHETIVGMNPVYLDGWRRAVRAVRAALAHEHDAAYEALNREIADLAALVHGQPAVAQRDRLRAFVVADDAYDAACVAGTVDGDYGVIERRNAAYQALLAHGDLEVDHE